MCAGAIDVEELQYALEVMGIQKTAADVQELMDSVDKDGSGELHHIPARAGPQQIWHAVVRTPHDPAFQQTSKGSSAHGVC